MLLLVSCGADAEPAPSDAADAESAGDRDASVAAGDDGATPTTEPAPLDPTEIPGEPINQYNLSVRDCFDQIADRRDGRPVTITTKIPCAEPHHFEVFALLNHPAEHPTPYPGDAAIRDFAVKSCYREFRPWVGTEYETSALDLGVIIPNQENFESNAARYRGIHCWVSRADDEPMIGTSEGSGW